jgi:hypothetical protein
MSVAVKREFRWRDLPIDEQRIMTSALERDALSEVVLRWRSDRDVEFNEGVNNRGKQYAERLIPAATNLVSMGILAVLPAGAANGELPQDEALRVIGDVNNWWWYRSLPELSDPLESSSVAEVPHKKWPPDEDYYLDVKSDVLFDIDGWVPVPRMDPT